MEDVQFVWRTAQELSERVQIGELESSGAHSVLVHLHRRACGSDNVGFKLQRRPRVDAECRDVVAYLETTVKYPVVKVRHVLPVCSLSRIGMDYATPDRNRNRRRKRFESSEHMSGRSHSRRFPGRNQRHDGGGDDGG